MPADVYVTLDDLKNALQIDLSDTRKDTALTSVLDSASRDIDKFCDRYFGQVGTTGDPVVRVYDTKGGLLLIDDLTDLVTIEYESAEEVWTTFPDSYILLPRNAPAEIVAEPWTMIRTRTGSAWPLVVRIGGVWGWPAVPQQIKDATLLQAVRLFKSKDVPLGVVGGADMMGTMRLSVGLHPDAQHLVQPYVRAGIG